MNNAITELYNSIKTPLGGNSIGNFIILIIIAWAATNFIYLEYIEDSTHSKKSFILSSIEYELVTIDGKYYDAISHKVFVQDGKVIRDISLPDNVRMYITSETPKLIIRTRTEDNISREDYVLYLNN